MNPFISIIIPVYKVEAYINKCLDSILAQNYDDFEVILVDDGSPDNSGTICDEYSSKDARVKVIHKANAGVGAARNSGIDVAKGEWIMFVDSDDYIDQGMLQSGVDAIANNKDTDVILFYNSMDNSEKGTNELIDRIFFESKNATANETFVATEYFAKACCIYSKLYKREIIETYSVRFANTPVYEDVLFNMNFFTYAKNVFYVDQYFYHYIINPSVSSLTRCVLKPKDVLETTKEYLSVEKRLFENVEFSKEEKLNIRKRFFLLAKRSVWDMYRQNLAGVSVDERVKLLKDFIPQFRKFDFSGNMSMLIKQLKITHRLLPVKMKDKLFSMLIH